MTPWQSMWLGKSLCKADVCGYGVEDSSSSCQTGISQFSSIEKGAPLPTPAKNANSYLPQVLPLLPISNALATHSRTPSLLWQKWHWLP